jgi:hypothetical protein
MPSYIFRLDQFQISRTRAVDEDTDVVSFALNIGGQMGEPQIRYMGEVDDGDHLLDMEFDPISIDDSAAEVVFNYQIVNSGHRSQQDIQKTLTDQAHTLATSFLGTGNIWAAAATEAINWFAEILFADCDGAVAVDQIEVTGSVLDEWTSATEVHRETRSYPGIPSPSGCGGNSRYSVTWSVVRVPPEFSGQSNWRWCRKCQGLMYAGTIPGIPHFGRCPAGGRHDPAGSGDYILAHDMPNAPGQPDWRWCNKCQGLFFTGHIPGVPDSGRCPAGGSHDPTGSGAYTLPHLTQ